MLKILFNRGMKKFLLALCLFFTAGQVFAQNTQASLSYTGASHLSQIKASFQQAITLNASVGLTAKYADEEAFKNPVYAAYVPVVLGGDFLSLHITPFYYFKNKLSADLRDANGRSLKDTYAFGVSALVFITMQQDDFNALYSNAYLGASFARSQGTLLFDNGNLANQYYSQAAFSAGLHQNFYRFISFELAGTLFQYPNGITGVDGFYSVMDQQDLAYMYSFDLVHQLPKYTLAARATRLWTDRLATIYLAYRFGEFYDTDSQHSFLLGNTFALNEHIQADLGYNHLRTVHNQNKRDIFYVKLSTKF